MMISMKHNQETTVTKFGGIGNCVSLVQTNLFKETLRWEELALGSHPCSKFFLSGFSTLSPFKKPKTFKNFRKPQVCLCTFFTKINEVIIFCV